MADKKLTPVASDQPTRQDRLGFDRYVNALAGIILDPGTETPLTLGVFGGWGAGKTSLMRQVQDRVSAELPTVWFDAWTYNQEDALWRALLLVLLNHVEELTRVDEKSPDDAARAEAGQLVERLREALYRDISWTEKGDLRPNWAQAVGAVAGLLPAVGLAFLPGPAAAVGVTARVLEAGAEAVAKGEAGSKLGELVGAFRREDITRYQSQLRSLEQFRENFEKLVALALARASGNPEKLVVFVDDLDRCAPEKAMQVLEALKLFLDASGCMFVLGLDADAIEAAVQTRYRGEVKAREYLEKIVQLPFILPPIASEAMREYIRRIASQLPIGCDDVFAVGLGGNPRQVKRALNVFLLLWRLVQADITLREMIGAAALAKLVVIQHSLPHLYELVRLNPQSLIDLERYFRARADQRLLNDLRAELRTFPLSESLAPFVADGAALEHLLLLPGTRAGFADMKSEDLASYIYLARQTCVAPGIQLGGGVLEPQMVFVHGGTFNMGSRKTELQQRVTQNLWLEAANQQGWLESEIEQHEVAVEAFEIGRFPVTNAEYAGFVRATGHVPPLGWLEGQFSEQASSRPVVNVSWYDACAYVAWLAGLTGKPYRLPTEAEWEKAARWNDDREWPWGNSWDKTRANCAPDGPKRTTNVGQYSPAGDSPCGAADMAGNVWEWCSSLFEPYPYCEADGREQTGRDGPRVLRGGSWQYDPSLARCAFRSAAPPATKVAGLGFRVACSMA